jgi:hypothetical protein
MKRPLLLVLLLCMTSVAGAQAAPDADAWGEPIDGVQLHLALATTGPPALPSDLPPMEVQIRNRGRSTVTFSPEALFHANVEIDNVWYGQQAWASYGLARPIDIAPGAQSDVWRLEVMIGFTAPNGDGDFRPPPGRHRVRIRNLDLMNSGYDVHAADGNKLELVSNPVIVDIPVWSASAERDALIARTSAGGFDYLAAAQNLLQKYPDAALPAIAAGAAASTDPDARERYVELAGTIPGDGVVPFLLTQIAPTIELRSRMSAARALLARGRDEGLWSLMETWQHGDLERVQFPVRGQLLGFLVHSGRPDILDLLGRLAGTTADIRLAIVELLLPSDFTVLNGSRGSAFSTSVSGLSKPELPGGVAGAAAAERFLRSALDDTASVPIEMKYEGVTYARPRVCDMAALALSLRWPAKYPFTWSTDDAGRDRQIAVIKAVWRNP